MSEGRAGRIEGAALWVVAALIAALVGFTQARWILVRYSHGGELIDGGWFAYLFGAADPLLHDPRTVDGELYYVHHLSPYIYLIGAPLARGLGLDGITIFALHQGAFFALFAGSLIALALSAPDPARRRIGFVAAAAIGAGGELLFQAANYPHFEIALLALTALALAARAHGRQWLFVAALIAMGLVREDGGVYAAFVLALCAGLEFPEASCPRERIMALLGAAVFAGCVAIAASHAQALVFPQSNTFTNNLAGDHWRHVTLAEIARRFAIVAGKPLYPTIAIGTLILARFDLRYALGLILAAPLLVLYFLAARESLWTFSLYYGLPWLLPSVGWIVTFAVRRGAPQFLEAAVLIALAAFASAPAQSLFGPGFGYVAREAWTGEIGDFKAMRAFFAARAAAARPELCVTYAVAALDPDAYEPRELIEFGADLPRCATVLSLGEANREFIDAHARAAGLVASGSVSFATAYRRERP
jgi:hypothetical protein